MKSHTEFLALAAAAIDFPLRPAERRRLDEHLSTCATCPGIAAAMRRDAAQFASITVMPLPERRQAVLLRSALTQSESHTLQLVAIAALLALLLTGSLLVAGAQLTRRPDADLSLVVPVPSATDAPTSPMEEPSASASASPPPSTAPSGASDGEPPATPAVVVRTPEPATDSVPIALDSIAVVVTNDLRVRSKPEVSDTSERLSPLLQEGQQVFVVDGPVSGSGYEWYLVAPIGGFEANDLPFGWVAAFDKNGDSWLGTDSLDCPAVPDTFASFIAVAADGQRIVPLACFGDRSISFPARIVRPEATCGADPGWTIEPEWLGGTCTAPEFLFLDQSGSMEEYRDAVIDPGVDTSSYDPGVDPAAGTDVVLTGQWDHPAARDCEVVVTEPQLPPSVASAEEAVLACRSQFVITRIDPKP